MRPSTVLLLILASFTHFRCLAATPPNHELVGRTPTGAILPVNQSLTPLGQQIDLPGYRPQALALSPDGRLLVTSGKGSSLVVLNPDTGAILQKVALPNEAQNEPQPQAASPNILEPDTKGQLSFTGLIFSPDGQHLYLANVNGSVKVFDILNNKITPSHSIALPLANAPRRKEEIPSGLALSPDTSKLYVCANLSNQLLEIDLATRKVTRAFPVGVAPFDVVLVGNKAYVSNWGGRRPEAGDYTGPAGRGTLVKVDPVRNIANEGSVTVIDLATGKTVSEILVHLHSSALALDPKKRWLVVANAASDNLSVIDTQTDQVVETIWTKANPSDLFGASPNALAFAPNGRRLYVANGTQNAIGVIDFNPARKKSKMLGLFPVGWFPGALVFDARRERLHVANIKGYPLEKKKSTKSPAGIGFNSHQYTGSISITPIPSKSEVTKLTRQVYANYHRELISESLRKPRANQPAVAIPERIGEPSLIKHVVYIIKENRTYDQVLGDMTEANGDPTLCIFPERVSPNHHKVARDFVLLDNTYCAGILSADGHQWSTTAFGTDYLERSFAGWPRSYPDGMGVDEEDALAYSPAGFIWDNALAHQISIWNFGEFAAPLAGWADPKRKKPEPTWTDFWNEFHEPKGEVAIRSRPSVETIRPFTPTNYIGWELLVPDVWRARYITNQIAEWEKSGAMPRFILICLPNDHTSGTKAGMPTPAASVADNDLAFGQIIQAFSHSKFWNDTAIFTIEDDPQDGFDHVSGYRTIAFVTSPYAKRKQVISSQYSTISMLRTMEQILGLPPMNQFDAAATPMFDCFTNTPDFTPYECVANNVALNEMNPKPQAIRDPLLRKNALLSAKLNLRQVDACPEDTLNRILWHSQKGPTAPYPLWAITFGAKDADD
jgi:YVTN family beta-propeller protein